MTNPRIWKYPMTNRTSFIDMPPGARVLSCQMQGDLPCFWVLVDADDDMPTTARQFTAIETGGKMPYPPHRLQFIATVQADALVFHIFEVVPPFAAMAI